MHLHLDSVLIDTHTQKSAGLKNNPTLTQTLGHYGIEHVLGRFYCVTQMLGC